MDNIKPCPFCGGTDFKFTRVGTFNELLLERYRDDPYDAPAMHLECTFCKTTMWDFGVGRDYNERKAAIISKWNGRVSND